MPVLSFSFRGRFSGLESCLAEFILQSTMSSSTTRVFYLSLVFLFLREVRNVHSSASDRGTPNSARSPSSDLGLQSDSGLNYNPCDGTQIKSGALTAKLACHNECLAVKAVISTMFNAYPNYKSIHFLQNKCGMVTEGKCGTDNRNNLQRAKYLHQPAEPNNIAAKVPICWCNTQKEFMKQQRSTFSACHDSTQLVRKFINRVITMSNGELPNNSEKRTNWQEIGGGVEALGMYDQPADRPITRRPRSTGNRRPNTRCFGLFGTGRTNSPPPDQGASTSAGPTLDLITQLEDDWNARDDGQQEGPKGLLVTDVRVSGRDVRVIVDTGCNQSIIHPSLADEIDRDEIPESGIRSANNAKVNVLGTTIIHLEVRKGVKVAIAGLVADLNHSIILGTDFFVTYAAKIRIADRKMTLSNGVIMHIKFRPATPLTAMSDNLEGEFSALQITARVNKIETRVVIDTVSTLTIASQNIVRGLPLQTVYTTSSFGASGPVRFKGATPVDFQIGRKIHSIVAFVPEFIPTDNFLTGNDFNKFFVELINYDTKKVSLIFPDSSRMTVPAIIIKG